ncbi:uncharacterized protein LOC106711103 isoform X2 [Papilio machaon]|uniref:uncharacterized protein LOC106711103 isoform X2 n=1 Tax=Papilio machaon TaxID=76193 RepID=UPI001E663C47|nr:uncharacterized protein LOC106711103 isoform X2 [Papilio machaon]
MISEFANEKVFWTRKMNLKLVYFIKNNPNVWNPKHPKYTSVEHKDQTYAEFAALYGNKFTGQAVKNRWTNIRSTFANYLRKFKASRANGEEYKINWHLWGPCQFLMKVNRTVKDSSLNLNQSDEKNSSLIHNQYNSNDNTTEDTFVDNTNTNSHCKAIAENLVKIFKKMQNDPFGLDKTQYGEVGQTVSKRLSEMDSYDAAKAVVKITEILLLYDEQNLLNPNNFKNEL